MCLFPRLILNGKYKETKKNGGIIPPVVDSRTLYVPYGCGNCIECKRQKTNEWITRLSEEIKWTKGGKFITLTFSNESIRKLYNWKETKRYNPIHLLKGYELDNAIATRAMRLFNERWRKEHGKALRHWMVTELGHNGTENIHLHGFVWTNESREHVVNKWEYGWMWPREDDQWKKNYVGLDAVNYVTKYVSKIDKDHKTYRGIILTSPGIGAGYTNTQGFIMNQYDGEYTDETYTTESGHKIALPIYYRNKRYNDKEKEQLWINKLNKNERWVDGKRIDIKHGLDEYWRTLKYAQQKNYDLGFGDYNKDWEQEEYEKQVRTMMYSKRLSGHYSIKEEEKINRDKNNSEYWDNMWKEHDIKGWEKQQQKNEWYKRYIEGDEVPF